MRRVIVVCLSLAFASCSSPPPTKVEPKIFDARVAPVIAQSSIATLSAVGTVHLRRETSLAFTTAGRIARITVNEGDRVRKGQLLAALDTTTVNAQMAAATAEQVRTGNELQRSTALFKQGWVTRARVDNAKAAYDSAVAASRVRRFATDTAQIYAPSAGIILARSVEPSQVVGDGSPVLVLGEEAGGYVLRMPVADQDAAKIKVGAAAVVRIASLGAATVTGFVIQIGGRADPGTGTFEVEIALPSLAGLRSGQIGSADIVTADQSGALSLLLPSAALFAPRAGEGFVYVLAEGSNSVLLRKVAVSEARDGGLIVTSGVKAGELVVVSGVDRLSDKQKVRAVKRAP
jgi:RND family efflux transporter MFP subunit